MTATYRCPDCRSLVDPIIEGADLVSFCCDAVVERVWLCETCETNEQHKGADHCLSCIVDACIADPREIEQCYGALQVDVAKAMAERLRPFLRQRQAA